MKMRIASLAMLSAAAIIPFAASAGTYIPVGPAVPSFAFLPPHGNVHQGAHLPQALTTWNGSINYNNHTYNYTMVGTDPSSTNGTTTITAYIVPIKMVYGSTDGNMTFDPNKDQQNNVSITQNILNSPLFNNLDWNFGNTDIGTTQYEDAFQRSGFWQDVTTNTNYHVLLTPKVLKEKTINVTSAQGGNVVNNPFGGSGKVGEMNINSFDAELQTFMKKIKKLNPTAVVIFVTDNIYLTSGGCCIGGYHSADNNGQTYMTATYAYSPGAFVFSSDISAFSHEIGEWYDDPLITSNSPCGLLEVGDPLERLSNYGTFSVTYNNVTWHPQDLALLEYFGAPANFSVDNLLDDEGHLTKVCQNGQ